MGGGENSGEMWRDATWESELMRHQLCDSTVAVCVSAGFAAARRLNDAGLLPFHVSRFFPLDARPVNARASERVLRKKQAGRRVCNGFIGFTVYWPLTPR